MAARELGLGLRTLERWIQHASDDRRNGPKSEPSNKPSKNERSRMLEIVNSPEFRDLPSSQIVPCVADRGVYVCSEPSMYRLLQEEKRLKHAVAQQGAHRPPARSSGSRLAPANSGSGTSRTCGRGSRARSFTCT